MMDEKEIRVNKEDLNANDDVERLFFRLKYVSESEEEEIVKKYKNYKLIRKILLLLSIGGFIAFFILIMLETYFIIYLTVLGTTFAYVIYLIYLEKKFRKSDIKNYLILKGYIGKKRKSHRLSTLQLIFYSIIVIGTVIILILSIIGINPLILLIVIGISLIYIYFDNDIGTQGTEDQRTE